MARPYWSGQIQISLVSFSVKLFVATEAKNEIRFHQISRKTGERVKYQKISASAAEQQAETGADTKAADRVEKDEIVKGYEFRKGQYVTIEPEEIAHLRVPSKHTVAVEQFVGLDELPPEYLEKPYFVVPENDTQAEAFATVREGLRKAKKAALGKIAFGGREHVLALTADEDDDLLGMMAYTMRYQEELRDPKEYFNDIKKVQVSEDSLDLAMELIKRKSAKFDASKFVDGYEVALRELVDAKVNNQPVPQDEPVAAPRGKVVNLMDALRKSVGSVDADGEVAAARPVISAKKRATKPGATEEKQGISLVHAASAKAAAKGTRSGGKKEVGVGVLMSTSRVIRTKTKPANLSYPKGNVPADAVDGQLARYRSMRDFHVTWEPSGTANDGTAVALPFCIQKHAASHLHYDFRLGWNGVLKSWAVAKGPSYFPGDKRLAVQVEDHPMEYGGFEGIIPAGQYGGGTVMLWDQGTWAPQPGHEDIDAGFREGSLKFLMHGEKITGKWTLIRMSGKAAQERKPNWLLIKEHDEFERSTDQPGVTEAEPNSVVTGRTMEQIAQSEDHVWNSKETAGTGQAWYRSVASGGGGSSKATPPELTPIKRPRVPLQSQKATLSAGMNGDYSRALVDLPKEPQPTFVKPQLALEAVSPPKDGSWLHELKMDGYRIQARKTQDKVILLTRSGLDWTYRVPAVAEAVAKLAPKNVTLDGEVVVLGADGTTNFADLQASFQEGATNPLTYFCFDLLHLDGRATRGLPLFRRKELLAQVLMSGDNDSVRLSEHIETDGELMFKKACELHAEGIISKRSEALYTSGRTGDWLKCKCLREQEFVIGGYTLSSDGEDRIGSLLLGYYLEGKLIYAGRTGTGFTQNTRRALLKQLRPMQIVKFAYATVPAEAKRGALWVKPEVVAQVRFATWTAEDLVRQAAFLGIREDKKASEVQREDATVAPRPKSGKAPAAAAKRSREGRADTQKAEKQFAVAPRRTSTTRAPAAAGSEATLVAGAIVWPAMPRPPVRLTHPAKVLDTTSAVTKQMLAEYLWAVADRMLPHITDRPLSLVRCPEGSAKPCFYQKHVNHMLPPGVNAVDVRDKKTGVIEPYITLDSKEALAGLAQMGVLEVHPWGSTNRDLEHADRVIFDLDPDESLAWHDVTAAADDVRKRLKARGLASFLKTTGGKGLHVVVPTEPKFDWTEVKEWTRAFVLEMERAAPTKYLSKMTKAARIGKIYLDYLRNERGATAVAPYSSRAREGLCVSMPLAWRELHTTHRPVYRVDGFPQWKARLKKDPWAKMDSIHQSLR